MSISTEAVEESKPELSQAEIVMGATNNPAHSKMSVVVGDRTFKIVHLRYDDYLDFLAFLAPLAKSLAGGVLSLKGMSVDLSGIDAMSLLECGKTTLPEMACIVCKQTDPTMTPDKLKELAKDPFVLIELVMAQIECNELIRKFGDFFVRSLPILMAGKKLIPGMNDTTPSSL